MARDTQHQIIVFDGVRKGLKIKPTAKFVTDIIKNEDNNYHEAIILVGTRKSESINRARSIKKREIKGKRLTKHPLQNNVYIYSPIKELLLEEDLAYN